MLTGLRKYASDKDFQAKWRAVKMQRKTKLAQLIKARFGDDVNMDALFDIHVSFSINQPIYMHPVELVWKWCILSS